MTRKIGLAFCLAGGALMGPHPVLARTVVPRGTNPVPGVAQVGGPLGLAALEALSSEMSESLEGSRYPVFGLEPLRALLDGGPGNTAARRYPAPLEAVSRPRRDKTLRQVLGKIQRDYAADWRSFYGRRRYVLPGVLSLLRDPTEEFFVNGIPTGVYLRGFEARACAEGIQKVIDVTRRPVDLVIEVSYPTRAGISIQTLRIRGKGR